MLRHPDWVRGQIEEQADDSLNARIAERQKELDGLVVLETRLTKSLQLLDDPSSIVPALNALPASRKSAQ